MRAVLVTVLTLAGVGAWNTLVVPRFPATRLGSIPLGVAKFQDTPSLRGPVYLYGKDTGKGLLIVGDSRVEAATVPAEFEAQGLGPITVLGGPTAQLLDLFSVLEGMQPRDLLLCLSPISVYSRASEGRAKELGQERGSWTTDRIDEWGNDWVDAQRLNWAEPIYPHLWKEGWFGLPKPDASTRIYSGLLRRQTRGRRLKELRKVWTALEGLKAAGWNIACARLPTSKSLRDLEDERFDPELFRGMSKNLGIPYRDYGNTPVVTRDGSHVVAGSARMVSRRIARDLALYLKRGPSPERNR